jgi:ring-1,2-phenylacetyl-CoA epoxidase subunit PaaC
MSSIAQDELGHARAFYEILATLLDDGRDADAIAYDREPEAFRHCRLVDGRRGDWAEAIVRRWLYDTADDVRLAALAEGSFGPLAELVAKVRREERYHVMHAQAWFERLARGGGEARRRFEDAWDQLAPIAPTVFAALDGEATLVSAGILAAPMIELERRWREAIGPTLASAGMELPPATDPEAVAARRDHSDDFRWLWGEFTSVRRIDRSATW